MCQPFGDVAAEEVRGAFCSPAAAGSAGGGSSRGEGGGVGQRAVLIRALKHYYKGDLETRQACFCHSWGVTT